jgi:hypothetical protein
MVLIDRPKYLKTSAVMKIETGNGRQRDDGRPQRAEEEEQDHRHEDRGTDQLALQRCDRGFDEARLPEGHARCLHAGRQRSLQPDQRVLDGLGQRDGVGGRLLLDAQDDGRLAFEAGIAALGCRGEGDLGDLAQQDGLAILRRQRQVLQVVEARGAAEVADQVLASVQLQEAAGRVGRVALERRLELVVRDAEFRHARGVGLHLELPHLSADRDHLRNAGHRQQARPQHPVGVLAHGHRADLARIDGNRDLHDLAHDRADRPHARHHALGDPFLH